jgi:predicted ribosomally synthesized peptide with SipW-like signal peptide
MKQLKPIAIILCAVLLVAASVLGTLAYLTSVAEVKNTFTVGKVNITLDETKVDEMGNPTNEGRKPEGNQYHLIPGQTYTKDPMVTVKADSEESCVRMLVTVNNYADLCDIFSDPFLPQYFVTGWDSAKWVTTGVIAEDAQNDTATYEFRYFQKVAGSDQDVALEPLFESFTIPGTVTGEQLEKIADLEISVEGHAIQALGFADEAAAWAAFTK